MAPASVNNASPQPGWSSVYRSETSSLFQLGLQNAHTWHHITTLHHA